MRKGVKKMKKIPTLFERVYENNRVVDVTDKVTPGMEWVLENKGQATIKWELNVLVIVSRLFRKISAKVKLI